MPRHTLYAYVEGNDLDDIAPPLEPRLDRFVRDTRWRYAKPWVVNQRRPDDPSLRAGDLPDWDFGLNMHLPDGEPPGWFADVESLVTFLAPLQEEIGRAFVLGVSDNERGFTEDLPFEIDSRAPDLVLLRRVLGVNDGAS
jgi:hypothetical protein